MTIVDKAVGSTKKSHLFMLRLWLEDLGRGQFDRRGKVQCVNSGEARYFRDWQALETFVEEIIHENNPQGIDQEEKKN